MTFLPDLMKSFFKNVTDETHLLFGQGGVHREGDLVVGDIFSAGQNCSKLPVGAEPVHRGIVDARLYSCRMNIFTNPVSPLLRAVRQDDGQDVIADELGVLRKGNDYSFHLGKTSEVLLTDLDTLLQVGWQLLQLFDRNSSADVVHADGAFRPLMQGLKDGKSLGLLVDQVVKPKSGGIWVRFFGQPVPVSAAPAFFASKGKAPVVIAWSRPLKDGRWRCEIISSYRPEAACDIWGFTQRCIRDLERVIRRHPSCWVLNYRYFRNKPTAEELAQLESREKKAVGGFAT